MAGQATLLNNVEKARLNSTALIHNEKGQVHPCSAPTSLPPEPLNTASQILSDPPNWSPRPPFKRCPPPKPPQNPYDDINIKVVPARTIHCLSKLPLSPKKSPKGKGRAAHQGACQMCLLLKACTLVSSPHKESLLPNPPPKMTKSDILGAFANERVLHWQAPPPTPPPTPPDSNSPKEVAKEAYWMYLPMRGSTLASRATGARWGMPGAPLMSTSSS